MRKPAEEENEKTYGSGYQNKELPDLIKKDENGDMPRPPKESSDDEAKDQKRDRKEQKEVPQDSIYAIPETGENRPAGGIIYGKVMSTAGEGK